MRSSDIFITCHPHIGPFLAEEIHSLGFHVQSERPQGVNIRGTYQDCIKLNLQLRTANRVLYKVGDFEAKSINQLYKNVNNLDWSNLISTDGYFSIDSSIRHHEVKDSRFANLKIKDAIVDHIRKNSGRRPNSGPSKDHCVVFIHWHNNRAQVYLDTSGQTISRHGYRVKSTKAPMSESLAAAVLYATGWKEDMLLENPMCGSGTIAIEAAMRQMNIATGLSRTNYGFMHTKLYKKELYEPILTDLKSRVSKPKKITIHASDTSRYALDAARKNAKAAGVDSLINFELVDFRKSHNPERNALIILNPEYGERLGEIEKLESTYSEIGDFFKNECQGSTGFVFTGNLDLAKRIGLRASSKTIFYNGKIECRLLKYELYRGTKKHKKHESLV